MKKYLGVSEVAKITGKERSTIIRWIQSGKFGNVPKIGNEYQVSHEQFSGWWEDNVNVGENHA